ncbi:CaiB/BaiF CoA transferase family protein [Intestinimonas butyriciproducens]|uniref:Crotonobetainyl-CoA:carnitine CoA-transferase CaiB-like acyl-CoA transferase n=1 Tax=Intestinimonas butyriciproducens TaxID=1297617 RepID=A0A0S2W4F8_9FIRM|nr:CoA transferase [Intestinimonas butyriciproducens]ALP94264.1 hypothetical protein IB211_01873c [Intestinimonas butyriciproducens]
MKAARPLEGVKVVELATFVAAPSATRFFADQGAEVIKVESLGGDNLRYGAATEGRPDDPEENLTFDIENANKKGLCMNLKKPECFQALMTLLAEADIFITNWRPQALAKMKLDYDSLKERFPRLVYGSVTGYGDTGPDKDLPGYDATAFFARAGMLGSLYERGTAPMNLIPSMGDRQSGMCLAAGVLAALYSARETGKGEKVSVSLMGTSIFMQGTMIQSTQYGKINYPIVKQETLNPLMACYKTKDGRFIQLALPVYDMFLPRFAKAMGREAWIEDPRFCDSNSLQSGHTGAFYDTVAARFAELSTAEVSKLLTEADLPFSVAQVWREVLEDPQAWATDCFYKKNYHTGMRILVRNPIQFEEAGLPPYECGPRLGEHTQEILEGLGYTSKAINSMRHAGDIICC